MVEVEVGEGGEGVGWTKLEKEGVDRIGGLGTLRLSNKKLLL